MTVRTPLYENDPHQRRIAAEIKRQKPDGVDMTDFIRDLLHRALFGYELGRDFSEEMKLSADVFDIQAQLDEIQAELVRIRQQPASPSMDFESLMRSIEIMVSKAQPRPERSFTGPAPEVFSSDKSQAEYESIEDAEDDLMSLFD